MKTLLKSLAVATLLTAGAAAVMPADAHAYVTGHSTVVGPRGHVRHCTFRRVRNRYGRWVRVRTCSRY